MSESGRQRAFHAFISGRVQGVGFRYSALQKARSLHLDGWVRNTPDGRVETYAQGSQEALEGFLRWLRKGPDFSRVDDLSYSMVSPKTSSRKGFTIVY